MFLSLANYFDLASDDIASDSSLNNGLPVIYETREFQLSSSPGVGRVIRVMPASTDAADTAPNTRVPTVPSPPSVNKLSPREPTLTGLGDSVNYELPQFLLPVRVST